MRCSLTLPAALLLLFLSVPAAAEEGEEADPTPGEEGSGEGEPDSGSTDAPAAVGGEADDASELPPAPAGEPSSEPWLAEPRSAELLARSSDELHAEAREFFRQGDFGSAALRFEEILRRDPERPGARNYLVECYASLGREDEAAATRDGAVPAGAPTPVSTESSVDAAVAAAQEPGAEPEEGESAVVEGKKTKKKKKKKKCCDRSNPRRHHLGGAGLGLFGPTVGVGAWVEIRPVWALAILGGGGLGGVVRSDSGEGSGRARSLGGGFLEVHLLPVPLCLTPVVGVGLTALGGPLAWAVDLVARPLASAERFRLAPYLVLGLRYDSKRRFFGSLGVGLLPTGSLPGAFTPYPGLRLGLRF